MCLFLVLYPCITSKGLNVILLATILPCSGTGQISNLTILPARTKTRTAEMGLPTIASFSATIEVA